MRSWAATWDAFRLATRGHWARFPEWLECGFLWSRPGETPTENGKAARWLLRFALSGRKHRFGRTAKETRLLVCHTESDSVLAPLVKIAHELSRQGHRCLVWDTRSLLEITDDKRSTLLDAPAAWEWLHEAPSWWQAARAILRGAYAAFRLRQTLPQSFLARKPFLVLWKECTASRHRLDSAKDLLASAGVGVVLVTHERLPPCSAFTLAAGQLGIRTVLYQHGLPGSYDEPVLSDEVLVWNETAAEFFRSAERLEGKPAPRLCLSGNLELESAGEPLAPRAGASFPTVLLLSQCDDDDEWRNEASARETLRWIAAAVRGDGTARFLIKERKYGDRLRERLRNEGLEGHPRLEIIEGRESFTSILRERDVRAVCAFSSSGLYVAAGLGVRALRLVTESAVKDIPLLDEVTEQARSEGEFLDWLGKLRTEPDPVPRAPRLTSLEIVRLSIIST